MQDADNGRQNVTASKSQVRSPNKSNSSSQEMFSDPTWIPGSVDERIQWNPRILPATFHKPCLSSVMLMRG